MHYFPTSNKRCMIVLTILYFFIYFLYLTKVPIINPDEGWYSDIPANLASEGVLQKPSMGSLYEFDKLALTEAPTYIIISALFYKIFGFSIFTARAVSVIFGFLLLIGIYKCTVLLFDKRYAIINSFLLGINPLIFYYSRTARQEIMSVAIMIFAYYYFLKSNERNNKFLKYSFLSGILAAISFLTHPNIGIYIISMFLLIIIRDKLHLINKKNIFMFLGILFIASLYVVFWININPEIWTKQTAVQANHFLQIYPKINILDALYTKYFKMGTSVTLSVVPILFFFTCFIFHYFKRSDEKIKQHIIFSILVYIIFIFYSANNLAGYNILSMSFQYLVFAPFILSLYKKHKKNIINYMLLVFIILTLLVQIMFIGQRMYSHRSADFYKFAQKLYEFIPPSQKVAAYFTFIFILRERNNFIAREAIIWYKEGNKSYYEILKNLNVTYLVLDSESRKTLFSADDLNMIKKKCEFIGFIEDKYYLSKPPYDVLDNRTDIYKCAYN